MVLIVPEQSQRPYRFGMTLLCIGVLFNWLGLADTYSDPVPAIRYIGVGLIAAGASLICMAMCFWMKNMNDPNLNNDHDTANDPVHVIAIDPAIENPPDYSTVVDVPPCYEDAMKLHSAAAVAVHTLKNVNTFTSHCTSANGTFGKNPAANSTTERRNSSHYAQTQLCDVIDFSRLFYEHSHSEKWECQGQETPQNSSQNENAFSKVLRKSIRSIRRLRSSSEDSKQYNTQATASSECVIIGRVTMESTSKRAGK